GQFESPVRADRPVPARRPADHRPGPALYEKTDLSELRAHGRIVRAFNGDYASDGRPTRRLDLQPAYIAVNDLEFDIFAGRGSAASLLVDIDDEGAVAVRRHVLEPELAERIGHGPAGFGAGTARVSDHYAGNRIAAIGIDYAARNDITLHWSRDFYVHVGGLLAAT